MTPGAKKLLSSTVRALRARLLADLHAATETEYRLGVARVGDAGLAATPASKRARLDAWLDEQLRTQGTTDQRKHTRTREEFRRELEQQAAYTLLNRLVVLRLMEASGLRREPLVTRGWESTAYKTLRALAPALVQHDASEGYALLLRLVCEELATDLPGLFGSHGITALVPIPASTLRHAVEMLDDPSLASCWTDDMTLGWVYQYWNDPEREALDLKLSARGKLDPHEVASKTQMFTERYMVDWLLQNTLGPMWLAICAQHGWTPEAEANGTLAALASRRATWRARRDSGDVALTEPMPLHTDAERRWAYYVPQPALACTAASIRDLRLLDPAVGSGHFLLVAFDLLFALYQEEARHRAASDLPDWSPRAIAEHILEHNLHGIDLDARAVQIAAAALWLKAQQICPGARPQTLGLVAANLRLAGLQPQDPALVELRKVERDTGKPGALVDAIVAALSGADHIGSLLRIEHAIERALDADTPDRAHAKTTILDHLEDFFDNTHTHADDLGLRLRGEQRTAGARFLRQLREDQYDIVVGNPPYQGTARMADAAYVQHTYPRGKADLYAAFLERGLQLVRPGGLSALLTMRNWMFDRQYVDLREWLLSSFDLRTLGDLSWGAFEDMRDNPVVMSVFARAPPAENHAIAIVPTDPQERVRTIEELARKRAGMLVQVGHTSFSPQALRVVPGWPLVYGWSEALLARYQSAPRVQDQGRARKGIDTGNNAWLVRRPWELGPRSADPRWVPYVMGGKGQAWVEPLQNLVFWAHRGLLIRERATWSPGTTIRNPDKFFKTGIAFSPIGSTFVARIHRYASICDNMGTSVYLDDPRAGLCALSASRSAYILRSLNPGIHFQAGDVNRLPLLPIADADAIVATLDRAFTEHEAHREPSVEFRAPGASPWRHAQAWAQLAVDRPDGAPLPAYVPRHDPEPATDHFSSALGVALGRFDPAGQGTLDPCNGNRALPAGILFLDGTLDAEDLRDSLGHAAARPLHAVFQRYGAAIAPGTSLRAYLSNAGFFAVHRRMYENRPIHWPLSSADKTFVAWVTIHRWDAETLRVLLADHLHPTLTRLDGTLTDLRAARDGADRQTSRAAEKRVGAVQRARDELAQFIALVEQCAEKGPPPSDPKKPERELDARYVPDLDDGVVVNAAALWPLLAPQWQDPKKWWQQDHDWSHLAKRYWPRRVDAKCQQDPSLALAHGCFYRYHPARAWAWELRLQDEIGPEFCIVEAPYRDDGGHAAHRSTFLAEHPVEALAAVEKEAQRRIRKHHRRLEEMVLLAAGLWRERPDLCWALELRVLAKQGQDFYLRAPDEPAARVTFARQNPALVQTRLRLLATLRPGTLLLDGDEHASDEPNDDA